MHKFDQLQSLSILITIVKQGKGKIVLQLLKGSGVNFNNLSLGRGTADQEIRERFGVEKNENDIVISVIPRGQAKGILKMFVSELQLDEPARGIAFTIGIDSFVDTNVLQAIKGGYFDES